MIEFLKNLFKKEKGNLKAKVKRLNELEGVKVIDATENSMFLEVDTERTDITPEIIARMMLEDNNDY